MKKMNRVLVILFLAFCAFPARSASTFDEWKNDFYLQAQKQNISSSTLNRYIKPATYLPFVVELDRKQPEFTLSFGSYMQKVVTDKRIQKGRKLFENHSRILGRVEEIYGVPAHYLVAFWGIETNFGATKGGINTVDALATLSFDERRSAFFSEQLITLLKILQKENIDSPMGSWAGAFGHFQFMPTTFYQYAIDEDGDGRRDVIHSFDDAVASAANYLNRMGWKKGETWGRQVILPDSQLVQKMGEKYPISDWVKWGVLRADGKEFLPSDSAMMAELILPEGVNGPAFLTYQNFDVIKRWNRSDFYALAVGVLADEVIQKPTTKVATLQLNDGLSVTEVKAVQTALMDKKLYTGTIDGRLGKGTRAAVKAFQKLNNLPQDGFLSKELLEKIIK